MGRSRHCVDVCPLGAQVSVCRMGMAKGMKRAKKAADAAAAPKKKGGERVRQCDHGLAKQSLTIKPSASATMLPPIQSVLDSQSVRVSCFGLLRQPVHW